MYYELTRLSLSPIDVEIDDLLGAARADMNSRAFVCFEIDRLYEMLVLRMDECTRLTIPRFKSGTLKFWWDQELDELKSNSVASFRAWQNAGKPRTGLLQSEMMTQSLTVCSIGGP